MNFSDEHFVPTAAVWAAIKLFGLGLKEVMRGKSQGRNTKEKRQVVVVMTFGIQEISVGFSGFQLISVDVGEFQWTALICSDEHALAVTVVRVAAKLPRLRPNEVVGTQETGEGTPKKITK